MLNKHKDRGNICRFEKGFVFLGFYMIVGLESTSIGHGVELVPRMHKFGWQNEVQFTEENLSKKQDSRYISNH